MDGVALRGPYKRQKRLRYASLIIHMLALLVHMHNSHLTTSLLRPPHPATSTSTSASVRLYAFLMDTFTEEQKISATARLVQDVLSHALETLPTLPTAATAAAATGTSGAPAGDGGEGGVDPVAPLEEALEDTLLILQVTACNISKAATSSFAHYEGFKDDGSILTHRACFHCYCRLRLLPLVVVIAVAAHPRGSPCRGRRRRRRRRRRSRRHRQQRRRRRRRQ